MLIFTVLWWNRYLAVTNEGWHFLHGWEILHGRVPYRDFFLFIPPLHPLKDAALIWLFGDKLIVPQVWAIFERVVIAGVLASWLRTYFGSFAACLATLVTMCLFLCDETETLSSLHEEAVLFPFLACVAATKAIGFSRRAPWWILVSGACSGLALLSKQTSGMAVTVAAGALLVAIVGRRAGARDAYRTATLFAGGWMVPVGAVVIWLSAQGALGPFLADCFLGGTSSKGTLTEMLSRAATMILADAYERRHLLLAVALLAFGAYLLKRYSDGHPATEAADSRWVAALGIVAVLCLAVIYYASGYPVPHLPGTLDALVLNTAVLSGALGCLAIFLYYLPRYVKGSLDDPQTHFFLIAGISFTLDFFLSLSWPIFASMLIPGFAFTMAFFLSRVNVGAPAVALRIVAVGLAFIAITIAGWTKMSLPFGWNGWREPLVASATTKLQYPETAGMRVSPQTKAFVERVVSDIQKNSLPEESVYEYPSAPILYLLSHRRPGTKSFIHFVDTTPDYIAEQDAKTILEKPPAVIVYFEQTEEDVRMGELNFRGGRRSGQRSIIAAIARLRPQYDLRDQLETPLTHHKVDVFVRNRQRSFPLAMSGKRH